MAWYKYSPNHSILSSVHHGNSHLFPAHWKQLQAQNITTQGYRFARATRQNVLSQIRQWLYFSFFFGVNALPASPKSLCLFMELLSKTSGYGHCKNVLSGVKYLHLSSGYDFPSNNFDLEETLQGLKRRLKGTPKMALPIDPVILRRMYQHINLNKISDLALWCGYLVAFFCLFRKANVVPKDKNYDPSCILTRSDVEVDVDGKQVLIFVNFSKTNQYMKQSHVIPIPSNSDPALDLYRHLAHLYSLVQVPGKAPAFSYSKTNFVNHRSYTQRLKTLLSKAGLDPELYSGHSFRRGGASYLYSIGGTTLMVQVLGDRSSQVFTRYLLLSIDDRLEAQKLIADNINRSVGNTHLTSSLDNE